MTLFVSSERFASTFGGLAGADAECQRLASATGFEGAYRALLSTETVDARSRILRPAPIFNSIGQLVANDPADLWDGSLLNAVRYDEKGGVGFAIVWTGTDSDGTKARRMERHLQALAAEPVRTVVIGDTVDDHEAAVANGARSVLVTTGSNSRQQLEATGAPVVDTLLQAAAVALEN